MSDHEDDQKSFPTSMLIAGSNPSHHGSMGIGSDTGDVRGLSNDSDLDETVVNQVPNPTIRANLLKRGMHNLHLHQRQIMQWLKQGKDLMINAETGIGKTIAVMITLIDQLKTTAGAWEQGMQSPFIYNRSIRLALNRETAKPSEFSGIIRPRAVVISPSRENAVEVFNELAYLCSGSHTVPGVIHGGTTWTLCLNDAVRCDILVATPGRLMDYFLNGHIDFSWLQVLILDEFLTLLSTNHGMKMHLDAIFFNEKAPWSLPRYGQAVQRVLIDACFGINWDDRLGLWTRKDEDGKDAALKRLIQSGYHFDTRYYYFYQIDPSMAFEREAAILIANILEGQSGKSLVFASSRASAARLASMIHVSMHGKVWVSLSTGDMSPNQRRKNDKDIRSKPHALLCAAHLFGKAVNIPDIVHVFFVGIPGDIWDFQGKSGRCGRLGNPGFVHTIFPCNQEQHSHYAVARGFCQGKIPRDVGDFLVDADTPLKKSQAILPPRSPLPGSQASTPVADYNLWMRERKGIDADWKPLFDETRFRKREKLVEDSDGPPRDTQSDEVSTKVNTIKADDTMRTSQSVQDHRVRVFKALLSPAMNFTADASATPLAEPATAAISSSLKPSSQAALNVEGNSAVKGFSTNGKGFSISLSQAGGKTNKKSRSRRKPSTRTTAEKSS